MNKALMISIQPQHVINILNGDKDRELRTWIPKGYVGPVYGYVTKSYPLLNYIDGKYELMDRKNHTIFHNIGMYEFYNDDIHLNGKVVFRFWFDEYETYDFDNHGVHLYTDVEEYNVMYDDLERLCLDYREIENYGKGKTLYAWHIKQLEIFDEPKSLSDFQVLYGGEGSLYPLKKAPQRSVWVYV